MKKRGAPKKNGQTLDAIMSWAATADESNKLYAEARRRGISASRLQRETLAKTFSFIKIDPSVNSSTIGAPNAPVTARR